MAVYLYVSRPILTAGPRNLPHDQGHSPRVCCGTNSTLYHLAESLEIGLRSRCHQWPLCGHHCMGMYYSRCLGRTDSCFLRIQLVTTSTLNDKVINVTVSMRGMILKDY
jgi:hypothetical protein